MPAIWEQAIELPPLEAIPDGLPGAWWVAHTRPRNEKALAEEMQHLGIFAYLPVRHHRTRSRATGRVSESLVPVFPSYLFLNGTEEERYRALKTHRIVNTLAVAAQERLVGELRQIHLALSSGAEIRWQPEIRVGDWARVIAGPLEGAEGVVTGRLSGLRLVLNVQMLGQSVSVRVSRDVIEPIERPSYFA
jgi:transcription antitermination factor NusG